MNPKILLIDTPYNIASETDPPRVYLSSAGLYLGTSLKKEGYQVELYDPKVSCKKNKNEGIYYVGDTFDEIEEKIRYEKPDIVGVTNLFSKDFNNVIEICSRAKRIDPGIVTAVGGGHATLCPYDFLSNKCIDIAVLGEGEETILDLMLWVKGQKSISDIKGIAYKKKDGSNVINEPRPVIKELDSIGFPDYDLVDLKKYFKINAKGIGPRPLSHGKRSISIITSRGCPYQCFFCDANRLSGYRFRAYSAESVYRHISKMIEYYGVDSVDFEDDNLSFNKQRFEDIVDGLLSLKRKITWGTPNGVRADTLLDKKLLLKLKKSGCQYLTIGVESGNQEVLNKIVKKKLNLKTVVDLSKMCGDIGILLNAFFIVGFPGEKLSYIHETLNFALMLNRRYGVYPFVNYAIPIKGTEMYEICKEKGFLVEEITPISLTESASFRGKGKISTSEFTPDLLSEMMNNFNKEIFRNSVFRAVYNPVIALRYTKYAIRNFSHFKRYVFG